MPASHHIDKNNKIIVTVWEGEANDADFIDAMKRYQDEVQCKPEYIHYNEILDFSKVTDVNVTIDGVKEIGRLAATTDPINKRRKLAIVASSNITFFFARMYKAFRALSRKSSKDVNIFSNGNDAIEWARKMDAGDD